MPIPSSAIFMLTILLSHVGVTITPPDVTLTLPLTNLLIRSLKSSLSVISLLLFTKVLINSVKSSVIVVLWAVPLPVLVIVIVKLASSLPWTILGSNILLMSILGWYTLT